MLGAGNGIQGLYEDTIKSREGQGIKTGNDSRKTQLRHVRGMSYARACKMLMFVLGVSENP